MNIKATLARLGNSMADGRAARDLLLLPGLNLNVTDPDESGRIDANAIESGTINSDTINIVVGYSGSQNSQVALDLTLLIAYQTRLATRKQVIVQTVYVLEGIYQTQKHVFSAPMSYGNTVSSRRNGELGAATATLSERRTDKSALAQARRHTVNCVDARAAQLQCFEDADQVLWQARTFATEWRGSLNTHLRFGSAAAELSNVAQQEQADLLIVGCRSAEHPLIEQLKLSTYCPVIGIPASSQLNPDLN
jgi:nucleotide-binding universal stress UspA family protein